MTQNQYKNKNFSDQKPAPESGKKGGDDFINNPDHPRKTGRKIKGHGENQDSDTKSGGANYSSYEESK